MSPCRPDRPASEPGAVEVFDRTLVRRHRDRAAAGLAAHDFLLREVAERIADRLDDFDRRFPRVLDLGAHRGALSNAVQGRRGIEWVVRAELSPTMAAAAGRPAVVADEEWLPFAAGAFDAVLSSLSLHWVNDLPGALAQIRRTLRPDGLFLAALIGGESLGELRGALLAAEAEVAGGASPRVSPFVDVRDAGALLQRAGFALPVVDADTITVTYPDPFALMRDLRGMGEANAVRARRRAFTPRTVLLRAAEIYADRHAGPDGRLRATFQIVYMTGWVPHPGQQRPAARGSGRISLRDALG